MYREWGENASLPVAFAVWVLRHDGLAVSPFDRHRLAAGKPALVVDPWLAWVEGLVAAHLVVARLRPDEPWQATSDEPVPRALTSAAEALTAPATLWSGSRAEQRHIADLWREYEPIGRMWLARLQPGLVSRLSRASHRDIWRRLSEVGQRDLQVVPVEYGSPVGLPIPPSTVVLGVKDFSRSSVEESFRELLAAARTLCDDP